MTISQQLRRYAKKLAEAWGLSYNASGVTKQDVMIDRAKLRDMYLEGYTDAVSALKAAYERIPAQDGGPSWDQIERELRKAQVPGPHDHDECPCGHPYGTKGACAGCNCADQVP